MKSVRLKPEQQERLARAAQAEGISASEFIRRAVDKACEETLKETLAERLKDYIGAIKGPGNLASDAHRKFGELLAAEYERKTGQRVR